MEFDSSLRPHHAFAYFKMNDTKMSQRPDLPAIDVGYLFYYNLRLQMQQLQTYYDSFLTPVSTDSLHLTSLRNLYNEPKTREMDSYIQLSFLVRLDHKLFTSHLDQCAFRRVTASSVIWNNAHSHPRYHSSPSIKRLMRRNRRRNQQLLIFQQRRPSQRLLPPHIAFLHCYLRISQPLYIRFKRSKPPHQPRIPLPIEHLPHDILIRIPRPTPTQIPNPPPSPNIHTPP